MIESSSSEPGALTVEKLQMCDCSVTQMFGEAACFMNSIEDQYEDVLHYQHHVHVATSEHVPLSSDDGISNCVYPIQVSPVVHSVTVYNR